jgi:nitrogen fixation-related uncharacterized protein
VTGTADNFDEKRCVLLWFSRQAGPTQAEILAQAFLTDGAEALEALLWTIKSAGYDDEKAYKSSRTISAEASRKISDRRKARGYERLSHRAKVKAWLNVNHGKVLELRSCGLSWRRISSAVIQDYNISISHQTLKKYWREYA